MFFFTTPILLFTITVDKMESRNNFFPTSFSRDPLGNDDFTFLKKFFFLKNHKKHTASLISTLNMGETNKIKLTNYFIPRMRVFIQNFTNIEKELKCRGKKITYPKC